MSHQGTTRMVYPDFFVDGVVEDAVTLHDAIQCHHSYFAISKIACHDFSVEGVVENPATLTFPI